MTHAALSILRSAVLGILLLTSPAVWAADLRAGERIQVPAGTVIGEDLYAVGREVTIDGVVQGDAIVAASVLTVRGRIEGSLMAAGGTLIIDGQTGRAARLAGGEVRFSGKAGSDLVAACGNLTFGEAGSVGTDLLVAGGVLDVAGTVGRSVQVAGERVRLAGSAQSAAVRAGTLSVQPTAAIPSLVYGVRDPLQLAPAARIGHSEERPGWAPTKQSPLLALLLATLVAYVTGAVLLWLWPGPAAAATRLLGERPGAAALFGLAIAILGPVLIGFGMVTVIGFPIAALSAMLYSFGLYFGYLTSANVVGDFLSKQLGRPIRPIVAYLIGCVALTVVGMIPVLGGLVRLAATLLGLGGLWLWLSGLPWFAAHFRKPGSLDG